MNRFFRILAAGILLGLPWIAPSQAQQVNMYCQVSAGPPQQWAPCNVANPLSVNASVSASITGFPTTQSTGTPISVTTGGVSGTLPTGAVVVASNVGATNGAYCKLGASATTSDQLIPPTSWFAFTVGSATQLTCITSTSTTTVNMVGGSGLPTGSGGGGGGGSGGAVTNAGTFAVQLTGATNNINNIAGTITLPTGAATSALQSTINTTLGSPFQAGASIGNTTFAATQATAANLNATIVGPTADGTAASTNPVLIAGTADGTATGAVKVMKVDATGNVAANTSQMGGTAINSGCVSNYGTAPSAVACPSATVFVSNATPGIANNADAIAAVAASSSSPVPVNTYCYVFNGTTWDRCRSGATTGSVLTALSATPTIANGNAVVPTIAGAVYSATNGAYSNLLQGNAVLSATNGVYANLLQGNAVIASGNPLFAQLTAGSAALGSVFGPTAVGSANANPPIVIGGTATGAAGANVQGLSIVAPSVAPVTATNTAVVVDLRPDSPGIITLGPVTTATSLSAVNNSQYPVNSVTTTPTPKTGNATGTTGAVVGTLGAVASVTNYICGFNVSAIGGTAAVGPVTIAGLIGSSQVYQAVSSVAGGVVLREQFSPCIPASAANTAITVTTTADGTASAVDVNSWGYQL